MRQDKRDLSRGRRSAARRRWAPATAGLVVALAAVGGQVARLIQARRDGDIAEAASLARGMLIGFPSAAAAVALGLLAILLLYAPGLVRARRLRERFPDRLVLPVTRPVAFVELRGALLPAGQSRLTASFTIVADEKQISWWGGLMRYRVRACVPWSEVSSIVPVEHAPVVERSVGGFVVSIRSADWPATFDCYLVNSPWVHRVNLQRGPVVEAVEMLTALKGQSGHES